jgi:hypothetical protein
MASVDQIESDILNLSPEEFRRLTDWLARLDQDQWDAELARDVSDGKLEALADEAVADFKAGRCRKL